MIWQNSISMKKNVDKRRAILKSLVFKCESFSKEFFEKAFKKRAEGDCGNHLSFYSFEDLQLQMKRYLRRSNRIPMSVLGRKSPVEKRREIEFARVSC